MEAPVSGGAHCSLHTLLEDLGAIHLDQAQVGVIVLLPVTHRGRLGW